MANIQVWVGDLAEYNNGNLHGEWVTLPMELDEILKVCLKEGNEEWEIFDTDSEVDLSGLSLSQMNELAEKLDSLSDWEEETLLAIIESGHFSDLESAFSCFEDGEYMLYSGCSDMSDVAYEYYEQTGQLQELSKHINPSYIDWERIGRDMEIEGYFYHVGKGSYIQIW